MTDIWHLTPNGGGGIKTIRIVRVCMCACVCERICMQFSVAQLPRMTFVHRLSPANSERPTPISSSSLRVYTEMLYTNRDRKEAPC